MAKRMSETDKWHDSWFVELSPKGKILFLFLCDMCDIAGFYERSDRMMKFYLGMDNDDLNIATEEIAKSVAFKGGVYFVKNFIEHQKNFPLNPDNNCHRAIITKLKSRSPEFREYYPPEATMWCAASQPASEGPKQVAPAAPAEQKKSFSFEHIWSRYPSKDGRKIAERSFKASVKTEQDWNDINQALDNYLKSERVIKGFIKNGSTWFNNWRDWVSYTGPETAESSPEFKKLCEMTERSRYAGTAPAGKL